MNLEIDRGDSYVADWGLYNELGDPEPIAGKIIWFTVKFRYSDTDSEEIVWQGSTINGGIVIVDDDGGIFRPLMPGSATYGFPSVLTTCIYDIKTKDPYGFIKTAASGNFLVKPNVTRSVS